MGKKGNLMTFRPDIKVVDCTIRDGGLVNNFMFSEQFIKDLYNTNVNAGVDYMEFGYKASSDLFPEDKFGKWKFCHEQDIIDVVGDKDNDMKISVMADVGRTNLQRDICDKGNSAIDMIRIATYINTIPAAIDMVEYCHKKGYETTVNIMAISKATESDLQQALEILCESSVDAVYLVDSYGSLYPEQIRELSDKYLEAASKTNKIIGIHAHNNQQLAFANTIEATAMGVSYLDATIGSLGRGAGNCPMELLLGFLKNPRYNIAYILKFLEQHILPLQASGLKWGYDIPYILTGRFNRHPSAGIEFTKENRTDYLNFYHEILDHE